MCVEVESGMGVEVARLGMVWVWRFHEGELAARCKPASSYASLRIGEPLAPGDYGTK